MTNTKVVFEVTRVFNYSYASGIQIDFTLPIKRRVRLWFGGANPEIKEYAEQLVNLMPERFLTGGMLNHDLQGTDGAFCYSIYSYS